MSEPTGRRAGRLARQLSAWRHSRRRQATINGGARVGCSLTDMVWVALAIPAAAPDWLSQCTYYTCRSQRAALPVSVFTDLDATDRTAVGRAAEALWDALEHCP